MIGYPGERAAAGRSPDVSNNLDRLDIDRTAIDWLKSAARLPGRSLHVALMLILASEGDGRCVIAFGNLQVAEIGLDRCAKYRGLHELERAGLVAVERRVGRAPFVRICWPGR